MEFICSKEDIQKSLSHGEGIVSSRTTLSILANVLLETKDNALEISATDLEVGYKTKIPAEIKRTGAITIQARKLSEIIKSFGNGNISFNLDEQNRVEISSEDPKIKANFKIMGLPKEDYPNIPISDTNKVLSLSQALLKEMIRKTIFAASTDEARYFLNGIYFEKKEEKLNLVATDGKRLSFITVPLEGGSDEVFDVIVPSKVLHELVKILKDEGECKLSLDENKIFFKMGETELVSNLLEGQYPNYTQVIPSESKNILQVDKLELVEAVKRVSHMTDPKLAQLRFDIEPGQITIYGRHPDFGEGKDEVEVNYNGEKLSTAFNYNYLLDALKEIERKDILFEMTSGTSPIIVKGLDDQDYFSVVMPMKLTEE